MDELFDDVGEGTELTEPSLACEVLAVLGWRLWEPRGLGAWLLPDGRWPELRLSGSG